MQNIASFKIKFCFPLPYSSQITPGLADRCWLVRWPSDPISPAAAAAAHRGECSLQPREVPTNSGLIQIHPCLGHLICTGWHKKTVITKFRITSEVLFRSSPNFGHLRSHLCSIHPPSFKSSLRILLVQCVFYWRSTMCSRWAPRRCRA